jgi:tRNA A-37 threonylcarbamoyl transferase component Bud32
VTSLYQEIDEIFKQVDRINLKNYTKIIKEDSSDLLMMIFYCLRKITKLVDDCVISKARSNSLTGKNRIANSRLINLRSFSPEPQKRTNVLRSAKRPLNATDEPSDSQKKLPRIDLNKNPLSILNDLSLSTRNSRDTSRNSREPSRGNSRLIDSIDYNTAGTPEKSNKVIKINKNRIINMPEIINKDDYYYSRNASRSSRNDISTESHNGSTIITDISNRGKNILSTSLPKNKSKMNKGSVLNIFVGKKQSMNNNPLAKEDNNIYPIGKKNFSSNVPNRVDSDNTFSLYSGYLHKFNSTQTELKRYWFVLKNYKLLYFTEKDKKSPSGLINLIKCFVKKEGKVNICNKSLYCFHLYHNLHRESYFCEDESFFDSWVTNINNFCETKETISNYKIIEYIGQGKFSVVHKGVRIENNMEVAVKIIRKSKMEDVDLECTRREVSILQVTEHSNIIKMKSFYENYEYIYIIQELFPSTDLFDYLQSHDFNIDEDRSKNIVKQLVSAIDYIHRIGIVHRDIKPENILIRESVNKNNLKKELCVKIIDFGLSRFLAQNELVRDEPFGTMVYIFITKIVLRSS